MFSTSLNVLPHSSGETFLAKLGKALPVYGVFFKDHSTKIIQQGPTRAVFHDERSTIPVYHLRAVFHGGRPDPLSQSTIIVISAQLSNKVTNIWYISKSPIGKNVNFCSWKPTGGDCGIRSPPTIHSLRPSHGTLGAGTTKGTRKTSVMRCFSYMFPVRRAWPLRIRTDAGWMGNHCRLDFNHNPQCQGMGNGHKSPIFNSRKSFYWVYKSYKPYY